MTRGPIRVKRTVMTRTSFPEALPHDSITKVADGVYAVRGGFRMGPGMRISRTMTILEGDDGLVLFNAIRLTEQGEAELGKLGVVKHLIKLSDSHGVDEPYVIERYHPEVWAVEGAKLRSGTSATRRLEGHGPVAGGKVLAFPGTSGWTEVAYLAPRGGGTLVSCDALQHHVDLEHTSFLARVLTPPMGFKGGLIVASMWRKYQKVRGEEVRRAFAEVMEHPFANLVTGHGPPITGGADQLARQAVASAS
jgi:hypothetical protein